MDKLKVHRTTGKNDWNTPLELVELVREVGPIVLDPCSNATSIVHAQEEWADGALDRPWPTKGLIYVNPPYGREVPIWVEKVIEANLAGSEIVLLIAARTDSRWFHRLFETAGAICFWKGRLRFLGAAHSAPFPSAVVYFSPRGRSLARFTDAFSKAGKVVSLPRYYKMI
jgi:site-specific DNA-methyltransferase (adenine-specific)